MGCLWPLAYSLPMFVVGEKGRHRQRKRERRKEKERGGERQYEGLKRLRTLPPSLSTPRPTPTPALLSVTCQDAECGGPPPPCTLTHRDQLEQTSWRMKKESDGQTGSDTTGASCASLTRFSPIPLPHHPHHPSPAGGSVLFKSDKLRH